MRPIRAKIMVKIKTDGSRDNIYIDANDLQDAYAKAGVTHEEEPSHIVEGYGLIEEFYSNGNSIKYIKI